MGLRSGAAVIRIQLSGHRDNSEFDGNIGFQGRQRTWHVYSVSDMNDQGEQQKSSGFFGVSP